MADDEGVTYFIKSVIYFPYIIFKTLEYLIFRAFPIAFEFTTQLLGWIFSLPLRLLSFLYGKVFAKQIREQKRQDAKQYVEQAKNKQGRLLLEYEELLKEKDRLTTRLWGASGKLKEFTELVKQYEQHDLFENRKTTGEARNQIRSFDFGRFGSIEEIAELAGELEDAQIRLFAIEQELKYSGFQRRRAEHEFAKI